MKTPAFIGLFQQKRGKKLEGGEGLEPPTFWV